MESKPVAELGDEITFPAVPTQVVSVGWYQDKFTWREEEYYSAPCFTTNPKSNVVVSTTIFIAREWVDKVNHFAPPWTKIEKPHILEMSAKVVKESDDVTNKWIETKITEKFFYGQDKKESPNSRWIVYHPADRNPSQGRFVKNAVMKVADDVAKVANTVSAGATQASTGASFSWSLPGELIQKAASMGVGRFGHRLYQFGDTKRVPMPEISDEEYKAICDQMKLVMSAALNTSEGQAIAPMGGLGVHTVTGDPSAAGKKSTSGPNQNRFIPK